MARTRSAKYEKDYILQKVEEYLAEHQGLQPIKDKDGNFVKYVWDFPIYEECLLENGWTKSQIHVRRKEDEEIEQAFRELCDVKAIRVQRGGAFGFIEKTMSQRLLNQLEDAEAQREGVIKIKLEGADGLAE